MKFKFDRLQTDFAWSHHILSSIKPVARIDDEYAVPQIVDL